MTIFNTSIPPMLKLSNFPPRFSGSEDSDDEQFYARFYEGSAKRLRHEPDSFTKENRKKRSVTETVVDQEATLEAIQKAQQNYQEQVQHHTNSLIGWHLLKEQFQIQLESQLQEALTSAKQLIDESAKQVLDNQPFLYRMAARANPEPLEQAKREQLKELEDSFRAEMSKTPFIIPRPTTPIQESVSPIKKEVTKYIDYTETETISNNDKKKGLKHQKDLNQLEKKLKAANDSQVKLNSQELQLLADCFTSPYIEVRESHFQQLKALKNKTGIFQQLKASNGMPSIAIQYFRKAYQKNLALCKSPDSSQTELAQALQNLHILEEDITGSHSSSARIYPERFKDSSPEIKSAALKEMIKQPEIRPNQTVYNSFLETALLSDHPKLKQLALEGISQTPFFSQQVNNELSRLSQLNSSSPLYYSAKKALSSLKTAGCFIQIDPIELSRELSERYFNTHLAQQKIMHLLESYQQHSTAYGPNAQIYLPGNNNDSKKDFSKALASKIFGSESFAEIDFSNIKSLADFEKTLQNLGSNPNDTSKTSFRHKLIFLNHLDQLDQMSNKAEAANIRDFFKPVFEKNSLDNYDFKDSILVVSSTKGLKETNLFGSTPAGRACHNRLKQNAQTLQLNIDEEDDLDERDRYKVPGAFPTK